MNDLKFVLRQLLKNTGFIYGKLVEVLTMNRLLEPKALFRIGEWADNLGVTDYFNLTAQQLNEAGLTDRQLTSSCRQFP